MRFVWNFIGIVIAFSFAMGLLLPVVALLSGG